MSNAKDLYRSFARSHSPLPLFHQPWWLDIVCGEDRWDVALSITNQQITGALPYQKGKKWGFIWSDMPPLTPYLGPYLVYPDQQQKKPQRYAFEKRVLLQLIEELPGFFFFQQRWRIENQNWLPFYWNNFRQSTFYTFVLSDLSEETALFEQFRPALRNKIRIAESIYRIVSIHDPALFYEINQPAFQRRSIPVPYSKVLLQQVSEALLKRQSIKFYFAKNARTDEPEAAIFLAFDQNYAYLLATGRKLHSHSGAVPLLIWQALKDLKHAKRQFDFEGSVMPGVEQFFRSFGGQMRPYYRVYKARYRALEIIKIMLTKKNK